MTVEYWNLANGQFNFEDVYNEYLIEENLRNEAYWKTRNRQQEASVFYPSSLWMCYLAQFLQKKMPKSKSLKSMKILDQGEMFHTYLIARVMEWKFGARHHNERSFSLCIEPFEIYLNGRIDDLLIFKIPRSDTVIAVPIEGKTTAASLKYMKAPKLAHVQQLMVYLVAMNVKLGYLVYVTRSGISEEDEDGNNIGISKTFPVEYDPLVFAEVEQRARFLHEMRINGDKVPPPEARLNQQKKKECTWCQYKPECDKFFLKWKKFTSTTKGTWIDLQELMPNTFYDTE